MTDWTPTIKAACDMAAPTFDGRAPDNPDGPHVILYGGSDAPNLRDLADHARQAVHVWRAVCVSNNPRGARLLGKAIAARLDGLTCGISLAHVVASSDPLEDRDDPTQWRWTVTVETHLAEILPATSDPTGPTPT